MAEEVWILIESSRGYRGNETRATPAGPLSRHGKFSGLFFQPEEESGSRGPNSSRLFLASRPAPANRKSAAAERPARRG